MNVGRRHHDNLFVWFTTERKIVSSLPDGAPFMRRRERRKTLTKWKAKHKKARVETFI